MDLSNATDCLAISRSVGDIESLPINSDKFVVTGYYGYKLVNQWKFETWNEPDLQGYNRLNLTEKGEDNLTKLDHVKNKSINLLRF